METRRWEIRTLSSEITLVNFNSVLHTKISFGNYTLFNFGCIENIYSLRIYDPDEQNGTNACALDKGGCQHLCLPAPSSNAKRVCKCALGFTADERNSTRCKSNIFVNKTLKALRY